MRKQVSERHPRLMIGKLLAQCDEMHMLDAPVSAKQSPSLRNSLPTSLQNGLGLTSYRPGPTWGRKNTRTYKRLHPKEEVDVREPDILVAKT